jgi:predicted restriction endonuclease
LQLCGEVGNPGGARNISAAHVIDFGLHQEAHDADLLSTCDVRNGLPLCVDCHKYFDKRSLWTFRQGGDDLVTVVSNALKLHPRFAPKWCVSLLGIA